MSKSNLFSNFTFLNGKKIKNRIALAPMTNMLSNSNGTASKLDAQWLKRFKDGGFGIIITPVGYISSSGQGWPNQLGINKDSLIPGLTELSKNITSDDTISIIQIGHNGARSPSSVISQQPLSASAYTVDFPGFEQPRALKIDEIYAMTDDYANAVERAYKSSFDGVELHFANGYLMTQFLSISTNLRKDEYGGTLANRARFAREILRACRKKVPNNFIIGARLSPEGDGLDIDETIQTTQWLVEDGLDFVHVSQANAVASAIKYIDENKPVVSYFREALGDLPIFVAGGVCSESSATKLLNSGADFVALGRIAIGNANWPKLIKNKKQPLLLPYNQDDLLTQNVPKAMIDFCNNYLSAYGVIRQEKEDAKL